MDNKEHIQKKVEDTFNVLEDINKVAINPFLKHKILQKLNNVEEKKVVINWFTPQLQLAAFVIVLLMNASAIYYAFNSAEVTTTSDINSFAQEYSLQETANSLLN
ncbi:hypothetical protein H9I45_04390 [Polaribacter haliotis]|uniref:Uncharacterized protein n=1 Tax=Polaribacter haliotis TaxID=1888915 RepID=A0A7L8AI59_9FLAO|nr:hypothetical protein [Polaribacter haliotis]QOD61695.1 hypothetical protein H9I45_04390 [Polaribacter haliotis]